jgi:hypothetical protein
VSDSILEGGQRGIRCNNGAPALSGIASSATIERNVVRYSQPVPGGIFSFGIQVQNNAATGSSWTVSLRSNRVYANRFGYFVVGNNSRMADVDVFSMGNRIHDNELGIFLAAGFAPGGAPAGDSANENHLRFNSHADTIENNVSPAEHLGAFMGTGGGLVALAAGRDSAVAGVCSGNQLRLQLLQTTFRGNQRADIPRHVTMFGSFSSPVAGPETGAENVLRLLMRRTDTDGASGAFVKDDSEPDDPTGTNRAVLIGSDVAFDRANP